MSRRCRVCLGDVRGEEDYHARCLRTLFGTPAPPKLDVETGKLHTAALAMVGRTSLSGVQKKISVGLSADRATLQVAAEGGRYILKPQTDAYPYLPENEHAAGRLARLARVEVAPNGLVALKDGALAYVVRRFDRTAEGRKLPQEDFCQLAEKPPKEKYEGSAELCVRLLRKYAAEPLVEIRKLYRRMLFVWWTGNGDMHLKNFSLLTGEDGVVRLSPAYDLVCTRLAIPDDPLALPIVGKRDRLDRADWLEFAKYCGLPETTARRVLAEFAGAAGEAGSVIDRSFLPAEERMQFKRLLEERSAAIAGAAEG